MKKKMMLTISEERHMLTKEMKLDIYEMKTTRSRQLIDYYEGRLCGMAAAYHQIGIIDMSARKRYIEIIVDTAYNRRKELANEV